MSRVLVLAALSLALACGPAYVSVGPPGPPYAPPTAGYVYTYADGSCWVDDIWHPVCPWVVGSRVGYYYRYDAHWYWRPGPTWRYRPGHPPPRVRTRDHRPPSRHHQVPPPRVRDHRRHRR